MSSAPDYVASNVHVPWLVPYGNSGLSVLELTGDVAGTVQTFEIQDHLIIGVNPTGADILQLDLPALSGFDYKHNVFLIAWNGLGTINFTPNAADEINGLGVGVTATYLEEVPSQRTIFFLVSGDEWRLAVFDTTRTASPYTAVAPNIQIAANTVDAGHESGDNAIVLMEVGGQEPALGLATDAPVVIGFQAGTNAGAQKVVGDNAVLIGANAGGGVIAPAAGEIILGSADATGVAGRLSLTGEVNVPNTDPWGDYVEFLPLNKNGTVVYIPVYNGPSMLGGLDSDVICGGFFAGKTPVQGNNNIQVGRGLGAGTANSLRNIIIGGDTMQGNGFDLASDNVLVGHNIGWNYGAKFDGSNCVILGGAAAVNVIPNDGNIVIGHGAGDAGAPAADEVLIGRGCIYSGTAGRLSLGANMEAVAAGATAGLNAIPGLASAYMPINYNGVAYKIALFNP